MRPPVLLSLNNRPSLPEAMSSVGGVTGRSVNNQQGPRREVEQLRQENEQLRQENEQLRRCMVQLRQEYDVLRAATKHELELRELIRTECAASAKQLEEARSEARLAARQEMEDLTMASAAQVAEVLTRIKALKTTQDDHVIQLRTELRSVKAELRSVRSDMAALKTKRKVQTVPAEGVLSKHCSGVWPLKLPTQMTYPLTDYVSYQKLNDWFIGGDERIAFDTCWRHGVYCDEPDGDDDRPSHLPTGYLLGRLEHSPGLPLIPGQPGTWITQNPTSFYCRSLYSRESSLMVFLPNLGPPTSSLLTSRDNLRCRYLGEYLSPAKDPQKLTIEEWYSFPQISRDSWCSYLSNPKIYGDDDDDESDWSVAARISLRKANLDCNNPDLVERWASKLMKSYTNSTSRSASNIYQVTPRDVEDAIGRGDEFLYAIVLRPVGFNIKFLEDLRDIES
ncbi:hypothetical protein PENSPDRAFT_739520 [Peniophora sp. CONT]|nr:hypothetical protein PENSPDRAFT_739520 [Peniophora sp. CONT]